MKPGPKPMQSSDLARRKASSPPPDLLETIPEPPEWCSPADAKLWWTTHQTLVDRQQLTAGDLKAVEAFVLAWRMVHAARIEERHRDADKFLLTACRLGRELGLSPNSRDRTPITLPELEPFDDLERFKRGDDDELQPWRTRLRDTD